MVRHGSQQLYAVVQTVPLAHLLQQQLLGTLSSDDEVHRGELLAQDRDHSDMG